MDEIDSQPKETQAKSRNRKIFFNVSLYIAAFIITLVCVSTGAYIQEGYLINVGSVSPKKFRAPNTVENKVATERNKNIAKEASEKLDPITMRDETALDNLNAKLSDFFASADNLRKLNTPIFTPYEPEQQPIVPKLVTLSESNTKAIIDMDTAKYTAFVDHVYLVSKGVLERGIQELDSKDLQTVKDELDKLDMNVDNRNLAYNIIMLYLEPNIIIDYDATAKAKQERADKFDTVYFQRGQTIVDEGDIINEEVYAVLEELGLVKTNYIENIIPILGATIILLIIFLAIGFYMNFFAHSILENQKEALFVFSLFVIMILLARGLVDVPYQFLPLPIFAVLLASLLGAPFAAVLNFATSLICLIIFRGDLDFLIFFILSGTIVALISHNTTDRDRIIFAAVITSFVNFALFAGIALLMQKQFSSEIFYGSLYASLMGLLSIIIGFGSLPLWEAAFGLVTPIKLLDLTNPDSKLLRRLAIEAPGTYHHSVIVANLAETAAYDIKANTQLARTGGYYHDIGKLKYPQYFAENMVGANPHDEMDPLTSASVILCHVSYGIELAGQEKLPKIIQDIIGQHHGSTILKFFYYKAKKENPSGEVDEKEYRYTQPVPQTREAAVVMLADTVEAAVRSMIPSGKSMDEVSQFIKDLIRDKLDDGQLLDSGLTIKDLDTIIKSFMRVFRGMYHERIPYPKLKDIKVGEKSES